MRELRRATAQSVYVGPFISKTDGATYYTPGAAIPDANIFIVKNSGASYADAAPANRGATTTTGAIATHHALIVLGTDDTSTTGRFRVFITGQEANALPVWEDFEVLPESIYDAKYGAVAGTDTKTTLTLNNVVVLPASGNVTAVDIVGIGTGHGLNVGSGSGASAVGVNIVGGAGDSSVGIKVVSNAATGAGNGIEVVGSSVAGTVGSGVKITGASSGSGLRIYGGPVAGNGITVTTSAGAGINLTPVGGAGVLIAPPAGQNGITITNTTGSAVALECTTGSGLKCTSTGAGSAVDISNSSSGTALNVSASTGHGLSIASAGTTAGAAVRLQNSSASSALGTIHATNASTTYGGAVVYLSQVAAASTHVVHMASGTALGGCIYMASRGTGPAVAIETLKNGIEIAANTATGSAVFLRSGSTIPASTTTSGATVVIQGNGVNTTGVELIGKGTGNAASLTSVAGTVLVVSGSTGNLPAVSITGGSGGTLGNGVIVNAGSTAGTDAFKMVGTGAGKDIAAKEIDGIVTVTSNANQAVYADGAIWIDTVNGTAGTVAYTNGTPTNPVSNIANALTLAAALKLKKFMVAPGSSITLASGITSMTFEGDGWTLATGGQVITNCIIIGAYVSGVWTGSGSDLHECSIGAVTVPPCDFHACGISGPITVGSAGDFFFDQCYSRIAGDVTTNSPIIDWVNTAGATNISLRHYAGGIRFQNMKNGDKTTVAGTGIVVIDSSCVNATVVIRGTFELSNSGNAMTIVDGARIAEDQTFGSNLTQINGTALASAVLPLAGLSITGATSSVVVGGTHGINIQSSTGNGVNIVQTVNAGYSAVKMSSAGIGIDIDSPANIGARILSSGAGISVVSSAGAAMNLDGTTGLVLKGASANPGLKVTGGSTGHGIEINSGATAGRGVSITGYSAGAYITATAATMDTAGIHVETTSDYSNAIRVAGGGENSMGVNITGGGMTTGSGLRISGGAYGAWVSSYPFDASTTGVRIEGGVGANILGRTGNGVVVEASGNGLDCTAVTLTGSLGGNGISVTPGETGNGIVVSGGSTSGMALFASAVGLSTVLVGGVSVTGTASGPCLAMYTDVAGMPAVGISSTNGQGVSIVGRTGVQISAQQSGAASDAVKLIGYGSGGAIVATPGTTGYGISVSGGATSGVAISASVTGGPSVVAQGGISVTGNNSGPALSLYSNVSNMPTVAISSQGGPGVHIHGRTGVRVWAMQSGDASSAVELLGYGSGGAIVATPGTTGTGVQISGGATSGSAISVSVTDGSSIAAQGGISVIGNSYGPALGLYSDVSNMPTVAISSQGGPGVHILGRTGVRVEAHQSGVASSAVELRGYGSGNALIATPGATGNGIVLNGGATSGSAILVSANDDTIKVTSSGGHGISVSGAADLVNPKDAIHLVGTGKGSAVYAINGVAAVRAAVHVESGSASVSALQITAANSTGAAAAVTVKSTQGDAAVLLQNLDATGASALTISGAGAHDIVSRDIGGGGGSGDLNDNATNYDVIAKAIRTYDSSALGQAAGSVIKYLADNQVVLAASQPDYAPAKAGDAMALTANQTVLTVLGNVDGNVTGSVAGDVMGSVGSVIGSVGSVAGGVVLDATQSMYAPAKAGDQMDIISIPNATAITAIQDGLATASDLSTVGTNVSNTKTEVDELYALRPASTIASQADVLGIVTGTRAIQLATADTYRVPSVSFSAYKIELVFRDSDGSLKNPSGASEISVSSAAGGVDWNGKLYEDASCVTGPTIISGWAQAINVATGIYVLYIKVDSTEIDVQLVVDGRVTDSTTVFQTSTMPVVETVSWSLTANLSDTDANKAVIAKAIRDFDVDAAAIGLNTNSIEAKTEAVVGQVTTDVNAYADTSRGLAESNINSHVDTATSGVTTGVNAHTDAKFLEGITSDLVSINGAPLAEATLHINGLLVDNGIDIHTVDGTTLTEFLRSIKTMPSGVVSVMASTTEFTSVIDVPGIDKTYVGRVVIFTSGLLRNTAAVIKDYSFSTPTSTITTGALANAAQPGDAFIIV